MIAIPRPWSSTLCLIPLALMACSSSGAPDPHEVLESAIVARYGSFHEDVPDGAVLTSRGAFFGLPATQTTTFLHPNLLRVQLSMDGMDEAQIDRIFDGRSFYSPTPAGPRLMSPAEARVFLQDAFDATAFWLVGLRDPNMTLALVETSAGDESGDIILEVAHKTGYLRDLHFDRETFDLVAMRGVAPTEFGRSQIALEFSDFEMIDGIRLPRHTLQTIDGNPAWEGTLQSTNFEELPSADSLYLGAQVTQ